MSTMNKINKLAMARGKTLYSFRPDVEEIIASEVGREEYFAYRNLWKKTCDISVEMDFPLQLDIELNSGCCLRCVMCPASIRDVENKQVRMDFDMFKRIIDEGMQHGMKSTDLSYVNEPLLRNDLPRFVAYAREKGVLDVMVTSSAFPLTEKMARELIASGLIKLSVSLDAFTKESYEKIRIGSNFEKVIKNLLRFLEIRNGMGRKLPLLKLQYLVTPFNHSELDDFLDFWQDKADMVSIQNVCNPLEGEDDRNKLDENFRFESQGKSALELGYICPQPFQRMSIRYDGSVMPCCNFFGSLQKIGNVKDNGIYEIYHSERAKQIRARLKAKDFSNEPICEKCLKKTRLEQYK